MRIVDVEGQEKEAQFAETAMKNFDKHPEKFTFAEEDPAAGELLAIRWNPHTVLVVKLAKKHEPACYSVYPTLDHDFPKLTPKW